MQKRLTATQFSMALLAIRGDHLANLCRDSDLNYWTVKTNIQHVRELLGALNNAAIPRRLIELGYIQAKDLPEPIERMPL